MQSVLVYQQFLHLVYVCFVLLQLVTSIALGFVPPTFNVHNAHRQRRIPSHRQPETILVRRATTEYQNLSNNNSTMSSPSDTSMVLTNGNAPQGETKRNGISSSSLPSNAAILINRNARSVTDKTIRIAQQVFGEDHVFVSSTLEDAQQAVATILSRQGQDQLRYPIVVPIGGDGTLTTCIQLMAQYYLIGSNTTTSTVEQALAQLPKIAYIPMGTGNAVGSVASCVRGRIRGKRRLTAALHKIRAARTDTVATIPLPLLQLHRNTTTTATTASNNNNDDLCFFCGVGFDSLMLQDFQSLQQIRSAPRLVKKHVFSSVLGYCVALVVKTLPATVVRGRHQIQVRVVDNNNNNSTTTRQPAFRIDHRRGDMAVPIQNDGDGLIYSGPAGILAVSTIPYYGGGLRLFPFARITAAATCHLRIANIHPLTGVLNLRRIFAGTYRQYAEGNQKVVDVVGSDFTVRVRGNDNKGYPLQHSGESVGSVEEFRVRVVDAPVQMVSFWDDDNDDDNNRKSPRR